MRRVNRGEIKAFAEIKAGKQLGQDLNHNSLSPVHLHLTTSLWPSCKLDSIVPSWEYSYSFCLFAFWLGDYGNLEEGIEEKGQSQQLVFVMKITEVAVSKWLHWGGWVLRSMNEEVHLTRQDPQERQDTVCQAHRST